MNQKTLELYLYMGNTEPIIKWLKSEGVKTSKEAKEKLVPLVRNNMMSCASYIGRGYNVSLAGTSNGVDKIIKYFDEHPTKVVKKVSSIKSTEEFKPKKKIKVKSLDGKSLESLEVPKKKKVIKKKTI